MRYFLHSLIFLSLIIISLPAHAESPINFTTSFKLGPYTLSDYDGEKGLNASPYSDILGGKSALMYQLSFEYIIWDGFGSIGVEATGGFWTKKGHGLYSIDHAKSNDSTKMFMLPGKLSMVYRFNYFQRKSNFPLVPYIKGGVDGYLWWMENNSGDLSEYTTTSGNTQKAIGATFGLEFVYGVQFLLDIIDPPSARAFDRDAGVNNTYIFIEGVYAWVDDFGSSKSHDLSDHSFLAGLLFEF